MALATRNLYLVLKARDEASRVIRGFGRELTRAGRLAEAENLRNRAGLAAERAAYLAATGASRAEIDGQKLIARQLNQQAAELERAHRQAVRYANALHTVSATLITVGSGVAIAGAVGLVFLGQSISVAKEYARQVSLTATQVDNFKASLEEISQVGLKVARNIAVPFEEIQPALYNILSSTNANLGQAEMLLGAFAKTAVAGQVSIQDAASGTIPILNAFNIPLEKVNDVLDIQFQLVRKGVGTYADFSSVFGRVVPSATRAGQSFETVAAMLAYLTRNGLTAAMASSSAARALDAMSNPKAVTSMENLGIKVRDAAGNMLPMEQSLKNLQTYLLALPNADRVKALVEIFKGAGGTIQARRFLDQVLLRPGELDEYIGFLHDMQNANGAFENAYNTMASTMAAQTQLLRNNWKVLQVAMGNAVTPAFIVLLKWANKLLQGFNALSPSMQKVIAIGILIVSIFGIIAGAVLIVLGALAGITAAIIGAGASFFWMIGVVVGLIAALGAFAAILVTAWVKSATFRGILHDMASALKSFWLDVVVPAAQGVKAAWDQYMGPALTKLADIMENRVGPSVRELFQLFISKMLPALKEVANFIKSILATAFQAVGWVITHVVAPAIEWLSKQYQEHKGSIDMIVSALVWLVKQFMKVAVVVGVILAGAFVGAVLLSMLAFVAAVVAVGVAIVALVVGIKWLIDWLVVNVPKGWSWVAEHTVAIWNSIAAFFVGIWNGIVSFFQGIWAGIVEMVSRYSAIITTIWQTFWGSSIGQFVIAIINLIFASINLFVTSVVFVFSWAVAGIVGLWTAAWNVISAVVTTVWNFIVPFLKAAWSTITALATQAWNTWSGIFSGAWNAIYALTTFYWGLIRGFVLGVWNVIRDQASAIWNNVTAVISAAFGRARDNINNIWNDIKSLFSNAGGMLVQAGKNIIQGLIDGMTSKINQVTSIISNITKLIRDHLPFSPAKIGPLSGKGSPFLAGQKIVKMIADGMASQEPSLGVGVTSALGKLSNRLTEAPATGGSSVQQVFNITTQEIRPQRHASELGFLLNGRL